MGVFPQYKWPQAKTRYAEIADYCKFTTPDMTEDQKINILCEKILKLMKDSHVSPYIKDYRNAPTREEYMGALDYLAEQAFDDQCTGANPRYPLIEELKEMLSKIYEPEK